MVGLSGRKLNNLIEHRVSRCEFRGGPVAGGGNACAAGVNGGAVERADCLRCAARQVETGGPPVASAAPGKRGACVHLGAVTGLRACGTCRGRVRLKVYGCGHPGHGETTLKECEGCPDHTTEVETMAETSRATDHGTLPVKMVAPSDKRKGIWNSGVLQIWVGRMCTEACFGCTQGSQLAGKPGMITVEQFERAAASLEDYWGTVGLFGGLCTLHPKFPELCTILKKYIPWERRGLWANDLNGHGSICRQTFNPAVSNLNVHLDAAARDEMVRDWPECEKFVKGADKDSLHTTPWVGLSDVVPDEAERWKLIASCDVNASWSAMIAVHRGELTGWFCEVAASIAMLHENNPDWDGTGKPMPSLGVPIEKGWWKRPMKDFEQQVRTCCMNCGVPMRRPGTLAIGGEVEEFSEVHRHIARTKVKDRPIQFVGIGGMIDRGDRPSTQYLPGVTPGYKDQ